MHVLVTGGAGFIGSHLSEYFLKKGDSVWAVDNLQSGSKKNIETCISHPNFQFDQADITYWDKLQEALSWADRIYHFSAYVGQHLVLSHPFEVISRNIAGLRRLFDLLKDKKTTTSLFIASSSEVYGSSKLFQEDEMIHLPSGEYLQQCYRLSKFTNEVMALAFTKNHPLNLVVARFFNTIGPRQSGRYGMVVPTLLSQAINNQPLTIYGDGTQKRCFIHISDAINAADRLMEQPKAYGQIVNIGSDEETSILELAKLILKKTGSPSPLKFIPYNEAYGCDYKDIPSRRPSLDKLKSLISYRCEWSLDKTLEQMLGESKFD